MLQKKVCMLGSFAVGKTSLVRRHLEGEFRDLYQTTVGVKIDTHISVVNDQEVHIVLWDIHGDADFQRVRSSYLRGAHGCVLVADGTRPETLEHLQHLDQEVQAHAGDVPRIVALNKWDLSKAWRVDKRMEQEAKDQLGLCLRTSAKEGDRVTELFERLTVRMLER